jgi:hypothetical protein
MISNKNIHYEMRTMYINGLDRRTKRIEHLIVDESKSMRNSLWAMS